MLRVAKIEATDDDARVVFGWASVAIDKTGTVVEDSQGDVIDPADLEKAAYQFVTDYGDANVLHEGPDVGRVSESVYIDKAKLDAMGLANVSGPEVGWWVGFKVADDDAWAGVKSGKFKAFSIEGAGKRVPA